MVSIGDPTLLGWFITLGYAVAAWRCWQLSSAHQLDNSPHLFWKLLSLLLVVVALNKQLDLQLYMRDLALALLHGLDMYDSKTFVKLILLSVFVALVLIGASLVIRIFWKLEPKPWFALLGCILLFLFVIFRAVTAQNLGLFGRLGDLFWGMVEIVCIALVLFDVERFYRIHKRA